MGTGASGGSLRGSRGGDGRTGRSAKARRFRPRRVELEGLEERTLLSTLPAATTNGAIQNLTTLGDVNSGGNAVSPTVAVDPNHPQDMVSVWALDISTLSPTPTTTSIIQGQFSTDGGTTWQGFSPMFAITDANTITANPPKPYTQLTDPSVAFDNQGNVYVLALQATAATSGSITLSKFNLAPGTGTTSPNAMQPVDFGQTNTNQEVVYEFLPTSDAAYSPTLAVDSAPSTNPVNPNGSDPNANKVYVAWATQDISPSQPNNYGYSPFNPNRIEMVVSSDGGASFSGETVVDGSGSNQGNQRDAHPQLAINQLGTPFLATPVFSGIPTPTTTKFSVASPARFTVGEAIGGSGVPAGTVIQSINSGTLVLSQALPVSGTSQIGLIAGMGQVTVGWEDFGTLAKAGTPASQIVTNSVSPGQAFVATDTSTQTINQAGPSPYGNWAAAAVYNAGSSAGAADPVAIGVADVNGAKGNDIIVADKKTGQIGELLNTGTGTFPGSATTFAAGSSPTGVVLDNFTGHSPAAFDAAVSNLTGGGHLLTNDGTGAFGAAAPFTAPGESNSTAIAEGNLDGSGPSVVVANPGSITIFPHGASSGAVTVSDSVANPVAVVVAQFRGPTTNPDIAVLGADGTLQFFLNPNAGAGNFNFTADSSTISVLGGSDTAAVGMAVGNFFGGSFQADLAVVTTDGTTGLVSVLQNNNVSGTPSFGAPTAINAGSRLPGVPVGLASGDLSGTGATTGLSDIAVAYANNAALNTSAPANESMVAVFDNQGLSNNVLGFSRVSPQANQTDFQAGQTNPTAIAVANLSGGPFDDIIVANNAGRGTVSVLTAAPLTGGPGVTNATVTVAPTGTPSPSMAVVPTSLVSQLTGLTVSVAMIHPTDANVGLILIPPGGSPQTGLQLVYVGALSGANIGIFGESNTNPGTTFAYGDSGIATTFTDTATRNIFDSTNTGTNANTAPYIGDYMPEGGSLDAFLADLIRNGGPGAIYGNWTLQIQDAKSESTPGTFLGFQLKLTTDMEAGSPNAIAQFAVPGSLTDNNPNAGVIAAAPTTGAGPGLVLAVDNTYGTSSFAAANPGMPETPYQGRLYAAFVGYLPLEYPPTVKNPTSNTDIFLMYSDDGGATWQYANGGNPVNDDNAALDGFSQANESGAPTTASGRTQFMPEIAVDPTSGTVVMSWRDARYDAANTRVVTEIATSVDGGQSFGPQVYANPSQTAVDAITGKTVVMGPEGDNQGSGNGQADSGFNYGSQMGLAAYGGQVFPVWAGNLNRDHLKNGAIVGNPLDVFFQPMTVGAGPRIVSSTMGPVAYPTGANPQITFDITFDRPVDPATISTGDVQVYFHDTTNGSSFVSLLVTGLTPIAPSDPTAPSSAYGFSQYEVSFDPSRLADGTSRPVDPTTGVLDYTGTYSYLIAPDSGGTAIASDYATVVNGTTTGQVSRATDPMDQNADGTVDQNALTTAFTGLTPGDVYSVPAPAPPTAKPFLGASSILTPQFDKTTIPLIVPGPHVTSTQAVGTSGQPSTSGDNLLLNDTSSLFNLSFDRPMQANTFKGDQTSSLTIVGPAGAVTGPHTFSPPSFGQTIPSASASGGPGVLTVPLTVPDSGGTFNIEQLSVAFSVAFANDSQLSMSLITPQGATIPLFSGVGGTGSNFVNTVLLDNPANEPTSIANGSAPFSGTFMPAYPTGGTATLSGLKGQSAEGTWYLQVSNASTGISGVLDSWSLSITPQITVVPVAPVNGLTQSFNVLFPRQSLSGTYTVQFGPDAMQPSGTLGPILDQAGDAIDSPMVAGLDVLRGQGANVPTTSVQYGSSDLPKAIPTQSGTTPGQVASTISVPDNFVVQGDSTSAGIAGLRVQLNASFPVDPSLSATLYYDYGQPGQVAVPLFSNVGSGTQTANFNNTTFDDNAGTQIQSGSAPFFATFTPQMPLSAFAGLNAMGNWTLVIQNASTSLSGTFNNWSLMFQKPLPTSGLGVPGQDNTSLSFRIFTMSPADALSSESWTAVGAAAIGSSSQTGGAGGGGAESSGAGGAGRVSGLAIDPSDPSGNTVYAAGASGGVWKTTNFLAPGGPTWVPLTDFGPTTAINIGSLAVYPRNHDPNQTVIVAATGEGNTGTPGVGFLISADGGRTWSLSDSTKNVDASGNPLPIASTARDRAFVGTTAYKVVVDPQPTPSGQVIIYAALSGTNGGIWRSEDTGQTWQLMKAGDATDVVLDPNSGTKLDPSTNTEVQGSLQVVYAAIRGTGVFMSPNQGQVWNQMLGGVGNPLIYDGYNFTRGNVDPSSTSANPNGSQGRIALAVPAADPSDTAASAVYSGWLYAAVVGKNSAFVGLFMTKDFGQNWVQVHIPTTPANGSPVTQAVPTNDVGQGDYPITGAGATLPAQGNYDLTLNVDPANPNVTYIGGTADGNQTGLIRVDATTIWDAHANVPYSNTAPGGALRNNSTGPATVDDKTKSYETLVDPNNPFPPNTTPYLNFIRNPNAPFRAGATLETFNITAFTNNGAGVKWIPFDMGGTDYHAVASMVDPVTGLPRLIFGNDQGIWSVLDNNGTFQSTLSTTGNYQTQAGYSDGLPGLNRNGNIQITQLYYGAAQPSTLAAQIAGALFYGSAQDNGGPVSDPNVLTNGNITWGGPGGDAGGVATDQQGKGTAYQYFWPCCGPQAQPTDFFQFIPTGQSGSGNYIGRTYGLLQQSGKLPTPDPQWPLEGGANFAVNPVNGQDVMISSSTGNVFTTTNGGVTWFDVGAASVFNSPGGFSVALAYGAPDPSAPEGVGNLANFLYVGTGKGQVFVSQDGGGNGTASGGNNTNDWINISTGLDGSPIEQIVADPIRGTHDAYAVTQQGVYYIANSVPSATNATPTWTSITGNLHNIAYSIFGQAYTPTTDPNSTKYNQAMGLTSIVADWQYAIPNATGTSTPSGYHPVLFVGAGSGVYESLDNGQSWQLFPQTTFGAAQDGGNLPHVAVNSLSLSLGNIDPNTGMPALAGPYQAIPFGGTLSSGSAIVGNLSTLTGLAAGDSVTGAGIPAGTTIASVSPGTNSLTLSEAATASGPASLSAYNKLAAADPNTLMAATYGRGEYAIQLAPILFPTSVAFASTSTATTTDSSGYSIVTTSKPTLGGLSSITAYGNTTWVTIKDMTPGDANFGRIIGGFDPTQSLQATPANSTDALGNFSLPVTSAFNSNTIALSGTVAAGSATITGLSTTIGLVTGMPIAGAGIPAGTTIRSISGSTLTLSQKALSGGAGVSLLANLKTIEVYTTNDAGAQSNPITLTFDLKATDLPPVAPTNPPPPPVVQIDLPGPAQTGTPITNLTAPLFTGTTAPGTSVTVTEVWLDPPTGYTGPTQITVTPSPSVGSGGAFSFHFQDFQNPAGVNVTLGTFDVYATATYNYNPNHVGASPQSNTVAFQINDVPPPSVSDLRLSPSSDTGIVGDNVTSNRTPTFIGTTAPGSTVNFYLGTTFGGTVVDGQSGVVVSSIAGLLVGETVVGTGIPTGTTIAQIVAGTSSSSPEIYLSQPATTSSSGSEALGAGSQESSVTAGIAFAGTTTVGSPTVLVASTNGLAVGEGIVGPGIAGGSKVASITPLASGEALLTLTLPATAGQPQGLTASGAAFTGNLSLGSALVTHVSSASGLSVGEVVVGVGIPSGATITAVDTSSPSNITLTLSAAASNNANAVSLTPTVPGIVGTLTPGSKTVLVASTTGLAAGQSLSGVGIPAGTTIASIDAADSVITLSQAATGGSASALTATGPIFTGNLTLGSAVVTNIPSTAGLAAGQFVYGAGLPPAGAVIRSVDSATRITLGSAATATATLETLYAARAASDGSSFDFSVQLPFSLTNGQTSVFVVVQNAAGNLSPASNVASVEIVSNPADYNGGPASDPAAFTRTGSSNLVQWTVLTPTGPPAPWFGPSGVPYTPSTAIPANQVVPFQGDFDGTGKTGFAYYNIATATWTIFDASSAFVSGPISFTQGIPNLSLPVVGHFDPNGPATMAVFTVNPATGQGTWSIASNLGNTAGATTFAFGQAGDIPIAGDFYGLGYDQAVLYRPGTQQFIIYNPQNPSSPGVLSVPISSPDPSNLVPVPGQYDNLAYYGAAAHGTNRPVFGRTEAAVYDPMTGYYSILGPSGAYTITGFPSGSVPAPADYLGIGSDQPAVLYPPTGQLLVYNPGAGHSTSQLQGQFYGYTGLPAGSVAATAPLTYRLPGATLSVSTGGSGGSTTTGGSAGGSGGNLTTGGNTGGSTGSAGGGSTGSAGGSLTTGGGGSTSGLGSGGSTGSTGGSLTTPPGGSTAGVPSQSGPTGGTAGGPTGIGVVGKHHRKHHVVTRKSHPTRHLVKKGHHVALEAAHGHHRHVVQVIPAEAHRPATALVAGGHLAHKQAAVDLAIEAVHVNLHHGRKSGPSA